MIWRLPTLPPVRAVPLALPGLTALFGMGRGEHRHYYHHEVLEDLLEMGRVVQTERFRHDIPGKLRVSNQGQQDLVVFGTFSEEGFARKVSGN